MYLISTARLHLKIKTSLFLESLFQRTKLSVSNRYWKLMRFSEFYQWCIHLHHPLISLEVVSHIEELVKRE